MWLTEVFQRVFTKSPAVICDQLLMGEGSRAVRTWWDCNGMVLGVVGPEEATKIPRATSARLYSTSPVGTMAGKELR